MKQPRCNLASSRMPFIFEFVAKNPTKLFLAVFSVLITACTFTAKEKPRPGSDTINGTKIKLLVTKHINQSTAAKLNVDTLFMETVDLSNIKVGVYFCHKKFHFPQCLPTNNIYKDSIKDRECNWKLYPATVECYTYDSKNRVTKMQIESSGTTGYNTFKYDGNDKIIEVKDNFENVCTITYDKLGNVLHIISNNKQLQEEIFLNYDNRLQISNSTKSF